MKKAKLLWTNEDIKNYYKTLAEEELPPVLPYTHLECEKEKTQRYSEKAKKDYILNQVNISFVMGCLNLVSIRLYKDDVQIIPIRNSITGDGIEYQLPENIIIRKDNKIIAEVINNDKYNHLIGIRLDVIE